MKNLNINVNENNVEEVARKIYTLLESNYSDEQRLERWIEEMSNNFEEEQHPQKAKAIKYIDRRKDLMLSMVSKGPVNVRFNAEIGIETLLRYASELATPNNFAKSYDMALRKLQQAFKNHGYAFSEVMFTWCDDGAVILGWQTSKPVIFGDVLDYPKSLLALGDLLDQLDIFGLTFSNTYHLVKMTNQTSVQDFYMGPAFKCDYFESYDESDDTHLQQECPFGGADFIYYSLDGSYQLILEGTSDEETLEYILEAGYHLKGYEFKHGLNGVIKSIELIKVGR